MIENAKKYDLGDIPDDRGAEWVHHWLGGTSRANLSAGVALGEPIQAYVNHSRWVVDCPDCRNAQLACKTDRRFMCNECGNAAIGGLWRVVVWPARTGEIEDALKGRGAKHRNWFPRETVEELLDENVKNGGGRGDLDNPKNMGRR